MFEGREAFPRTYASCGNSTKNSGVSASDVGIVIVLRKIKGGNVLIGLLSRDQLYLLVDGATKLIKTRYWKARPAIVAALDPVYDQIDTTEQNFCSYLTSCYENPSWRKWVYERYQPASQYRNREEHEGHEG